MCMTLILDYWETLSLKTGCNLYSSQYRLCVLTVRAAHQTGSQGQLKGQSSDTNMYFRERDKPVVDAETFLATSVPKILISSLIIFLNLIAIITMCRNSINSGRWISRGRQKGLYILPQSTQGLLHSLFVAYLFLGILTLYSQISLSVFVLGEFRLFDDQGKECLTVNSLMIALSLAIVLHLVSLSVDRTLASYLPYGKYTSLSRGTVPLWLLSIWMPSMILGSLPLAGWRSNFSFCIFLHQFKDDYIRFVSGFYLTCLFLIPCLYLFFLIFLKPRGHEEPRILYRWHRKLQAHHRLTFALVLAINIICWSPFHVYLLMACLTCQYSYLGSGFTLEYLYMLALVPSIIIPLMFSIRSNAVDKCANKISKCVHFSDEDYMETNNNPLANSKRSPLFFIDDAIQQHQREQKQIKQSSQSTNSASASASVSAGGSRASTGRFYKNSNSNSRDGTVKAGNFFVPHYLPNSNTNSIERFHVLDNNNYPVKNKDSTNTSSLKKNKKEKEKKKNNTNTDEGIYEGISTLGRSAPLRNFCAYLNSKNSVLNQSFRSSDSKYGFPIVHQQSQSQSQPQSQPQYQYQNTYNNVNNTNANNS